MGGGGQAILFQLASLVISLQVTKWALVSFFPSPAIENPGKEARHKSHRSHGHRHTK